MGERVAGRGRGRGHPHPLLPHRETSLVWGILSFRESPEETTLWKQPFEDFFSAIKRLYLFWSFLPRSTLFFL